MKKKLLSAIALSMAFLMSFQILGFAAGSATYTIDNPYEDVIWTGENAWKPYKGNLHTHSTISDASTDNRDMILEYYNQGFDFLAMTDHAVTGKNWNERPNSIPLYAYQYLAGNTVRWLTDEEFAAVTNGTYPVEGEARGYGMVCVPGGNELNGLTITKDHVNALFLPTNAGNNYLGFENDYEGAVKLADHYGALSFINHPGDWLQSNRDRANCSDPEKIEYISDIILRYDSCLGMEVFNEGNGISGYDRDTWDNVLMYCLPYGKNIIGFSNGDSHVFRDIDTSFSVFMMEENNLDNIKKTMQSGAFFAVTRSIRADKEKFGPQESLDVRDTDLQYPMFTNIKVDGHKISIECTDAYNVLWVANGNVIQNTDISETPNKTVNTIDLDKIQGSEDFLYVRCQLLGSGGLTLSQAFVINDGQAKPEYVRDNSFKAILQRAYRQFLGLRICVLINLIIDKLK